MQKLFSVIVFLLLLSGNGLYAQDIRFTQVLRNQTGQITDMVQDNQGFLWLASFEQGLKRYDGINLKSFANDPRNPNSLTSGYIICLYIDKDNMLWIGTLGGGLDKYDQATNTFTHFRHDPNNPSSISNDTVPSVLEDHLGNLWVGTSGGLSLLDRKTGKFTHYKSDENDPGTLSNREVYKIFEDKKGVLWVGSWPISSFKDPGTGGLNRFDRKTGKFTRYLYDKSNPNGLQDNRITTIYEDRNGAMWIGTYRSGLYSLDRSTGKFTRYYVDPLRVGPMSQTPVPEKLFAFPIFITEDAKGALWIGTGNSGMTRFDPVSKMSSHYGYVYDGNELISAKDTVSGFTGKGVARAFTTSEGLFWVSSFDGGLYKLDNYRTTIPFYPIRQEQANSFYCEPNNNILWIGTANGLLRRDLTTKKEKLWTHDPKDKNSLGFNSISGIRADESGHLWLATRNGLDKFDPVTGKFQHYRNDPGNPGNRADNNFNFLIIDHNKNIWAATDSGIARMDRNTGLFTNFKKNNRDSNSLTGNFFLCMAEDREHHIWTGSDDGLFRLDPKTGKVKKYIGNNSFIKSICIDSEGIIWAGGEKGIYFLDKTKDEFVLFADQNSVIGISNIINLLEDDQKNIWVSASSYIVRISEDRKTVKKYTDLNGVRYTNFFFNDNFKGKDGRLYLGEGGGYYSFHPDQLKDSTIAPRLIFSGFKLRGREETATPDGVLTSPLWETKELRLDHNQNVFSFDFFAIDYITPGDEKYLFMLENYDDEWHDIGSDHRAYFFNVPPGKYNFRVRAVSGDGSSVEKSIRIIISPPWWKTWWAYILYAILAIVAIYLIYKYQKYYIIKRERERTQQKELAQAREIEKAYTELKNTQAQLIQSEKMASLGELTAGIAHEIQNPLNFVNNFSEVNSELIGEMKEELVKGNIEAAKSIADNVSENEQKIIFHGKRADAIVKGMLQHSRTNSGVKESTDINALADEYLRLAYHGLRAKDKTFNAQMKTDFDPTVGKVNVVPQDIGRVVLNLITNAFYAVTEKKNLNGKGYEPTVTVTTKRTNARPDDPHLNDSVGQAVGRETVEIRVKDNGNGIPPKVLDKIFQPFFTTKPTGQGTGLGLSMSYDIVKAHGGELKVETNEGEGTVFSIIL